MKNIERYRGPVPWTAIAMMLPRSETMRGKTICQVRSFLLAAEYARATEPQNATKYGGAVRSSVIVLLYPKVLIMEGKKYVNDCPVVNIICMNVNM